MSFYNSRGNINVVVGDTGKGLFSASGKIRVTAVSGTARTGLYAADGSINIVVVTASATPLGVYHSCGAWRVVETTSAHGQYAPNGALYVSGVDASVSLLGAEPNGLSLSSFDNSMTIRSTLDASDTYQGPPSAKFTSTRASGKTVWDSSGIITLLANDVLARDYSPRLASTAELSGYLIEGARTKRILQSEDFSTTWSRSAILGFGSGSTVNAGVAPNGTTTADLITPTTGNSQHSVTQAITHTAAAQGISVFAKPSGYKRLGFRENTTLGSYAVVDLAGAGTVLASSGVTAVVTACPNGWYFVSFIFTGAAVAQTCALYVIDDAYTTGAPHTYSWIGDGVSGLLLWGGGDELAFPSSYLATTSSTVARADDSVTLATSAFPFSATVGTIFFEGTTPLGAGTQTLCQIDDGSEAERFRLIRNASNQIRFVVTDGSSDVADLNLGTVAHNTAFKVAVSWAASDFVGSLNGAAAVTDTSGTLPTVTTLRLGSSFTGEHFFGHIRKFMYLPADKTAAEVVALST